MDKLTIVMGPMLRAWPGIDWDGGISDYCLGVFKNLWVLGCIFSYLCFSPSWRRGGRADKAWEDDSECKNKSNSRQYSSTLKLENMLPKLFVICTFIGYLNAFQVTQPHLVAANSSGFAMLSCDYKYSKEIIELRTYLLRARHNDTISCEPSVNENKKGSLCLMESYNNSVTLTIMLLSVSDADLYVCRVEVRSPPPFVYGEGTGTIIYIAETSQIPLSQCTGFNWPVVWVTAGVGGLLLLYSIIITLTCLFLKKRDTGEPDSNSEYMDMRKVMSENANRKRKRDRNHNSEQFHF
ncbi:cytotoxic T-lymphocyte protein 4-like [Polyodon spathula]|uniref:cytotoxic T-lymphocyte protein 4-like n=1 Tax=Polyodon spathula TaxID=7913 RepID=UPI001B7EB205|nr:cytotoxic T-lymphocyte protein 4-like [Polyodon spathula]